MKSETLKLLNDINSAIIKFRGIYSAWSYEHGISYNEMLVLYTIREQGKEYAAPFLESLDVVETRAIELLVEQP